MKKNVLIVIVVLFAILAPGVLDKYGYYFFTDTTRVSASVHRPIGLRKPTLQDISPPCNYVSWEALKYVEGYPDGNLTNGEYYLEVAKVVNFNSLVEESGWNSGLSYTINNLAGGNTYYYRVKARDSANPTEESLWPDTKTCTKAGGGVIPRGGGGGGGGAAGDNAGGNDIDIEKTTKSSSICDTNSDKICDVLDFNTLMVYWGETTDDNPADLNDDNIVDIFDFNLLMVNWTF